MTVRRWPAVLTAALLCLPFAGAGAGERQSPDDYADWSAVLAAAEGTTVHFNAWGGDAKINAYLDWVADEVAAAFGIELVHVKLGDTAEAVTRVRAEAAAGRDTGGSVDLVWINGENFAAMKAQGLLYGPFVSLLPHAGLIDTEDKPTTVLDFSEPTDGMEAPWGMARLVFIHDSATVPAPPATPEALLAWAQGTPGRFTYPAPPDFIGTTFLKQLLLSLTDDPAVFAAPPAGPDAFAGATAPLWDYLDALRPHLWRGGAAYPANYPALRQLLNDGEIDIAMAFNPGEASAAIAQGLLPETVRTFVLKGGTIGNTHFVAIPYNASAPAAAMVVADFLLSPAAQARKADPTLWGDPTVLALDRLAPEDRALFDALPLGPADLAPDALGPTLAEPHAAWVPLLEAAWAERYAN